MGGKTVPYFSGYWMVFSLSLSRQTTRRSGTSSIPFRTHSQINTQLHCLSVCNRVDACLHTRDVSSLKCQIGGGYESIWTESRRSSRRAKAERGPGTRSHQHCIPLNFRWWSPFLLRKTSVYCPISKFFSVNLIIENQCSSKCFSAVQVVSVWGSLSP